MSRKFKDPIVLNSPTPLDDGGRKYNILYVILGGIGIVVGLQQGDIGAVILGLFGIMIAYTIKTAIVDSKWKDLRKYKFAIEHKRDYDELIQELLPVLGPLNMTIEKHKDGYVSVIYKNTFFDVFYNEDQSFTIWWRKSLMRALIPKGALSYYPDAVKAMGIIGYYVQQICRAEQKSSIKLHNVNEPKAEAEPPVKESGAAQKKYCTECGTQCRSTDVFCPNCGNKLK